MPEITYESIKPLIEREEVQGSTMSCTFRCPASDVSVEATAAIRRERGAAGQVADRAARSVKTTLLFRARSALSRAIGGILGYGVAGQLGRGVATAAADQAVRGAGSGQPSFSEADRQAAVVAAFQTVASRFVWDPAQGRWIAAQLAGEALTDFAAQLDAAPVAQPYDRGVLARMLVEIANADGNIADEEKAFLADFVPPDLGSVDGLLARAPLSKVELDETAQGRSRETLLMVAWALALTDEDLAEAEQDRLAELAAGLGIAEARADELKRYAQLFIIDQALAAAYAGGQADASVRQQVIALAERIGLDPEAAERAEIRYRKRTGLA